MTAAPASTLPLTHHYADLNGIRMHYVEAGEGQLVLFLHGFPESWYSWRYQLAALSPHYRVVAPDMLGFNETEAKAPYDAATIQSDVVALLRHLGEERAHIVGHDWGGAIAWLLAIQHPAVVRSLFNCNIPHPAIFARGIRRPRQLLRSWYVFFFQLPWLPERLLALDNYQRLAWALIRDCRPGTFSREDIKAFLEGWRRQGLGPGINWYRAALRQPAQLPDPVPLVTVPTTVVWGENDRFLGKELLKGTGEFVSCLDIHSLPGTSHWVQQEQPELVNRYLLDHLARASAND